MAKLAAAAPQYLPTDIELDTSVYKKEGTGSHLQIQGFGIYLMNKTGSRQKFSVTRVNAAS
jgi:hypothetical protein